MSLDFSFLLKFSDRNPLENMWVIFSNGGYVILIIAFLIAFKILWLKWRRTLFAIGQEFILLAIDVPAEADQSPKAVEQIFAQLASTYKKPNLKEKWIDGFFVVPYSFEIVSMEGYTQYLIRLPSSQRDFIEAIIYAQYPDAEIYEVEDYARMLPTRWPDERRDLWGTELIFTNKDYFPIKTYPYFEHQFYDVFADPLAAMLETMSKLKKGEYAWFQIVATAISDDWKKEGEDAARKLAGQKVEGPSPGVLNTVTGWLNSFLNSLLFFLPGFAGAGKGEEKGQDALSKLFFMTPGEKNVIEAIQTKVSKIGFSCKVRLIYWGEKEVFTKARIPSLLGALKQYAWLNMNAFRPDVQVTTKADYFRVPQRVAKKQGKLARSYIGRDQDKVADRPIILNAEELASLWHFPAPEIRTPLVKRTTGKKGNPPQFLPDDELLSRVMDSSSPEEVHRAKQEDTVPGNLPVG